MPAGIQHGVPLWISPTQLQVQMWQRLNISRKPPGKFRKARETLPKSLHLLSVMLVPKDFGDSISADHVVQMTLKIGKFLKFVMEEYLYLFF